MATIRFVRPARRWRETCKKTCINLLLVVIGWLAGLLGKRLVDQEAALLPKGWVMANPALAEEIGINQAIIFQTIDGWVQHNLRRGKNIKKNRAWSYNTIPNWGSVFCWLNENYVGKLIRDLEKDGRLVSAKLAKHASDQTKYYSTAAGSLPDSDPQQMSLWPVENMTLRGRKAPHDSSIGTSKANPQKSKAKTTTPAARAHKPVNAGGVAIFPNHIPNTELPEKKSEIPEARLDPDERDISDQKVTAATAAYTPLVPRTPPCPADDEPTDQDSTTEVETKSSGDTPPVDVPSYAHIFAIADNEVRGWIEHDPDRLAAWCTYAADDEGIKKPGGFVRAAMRAGGMPPKAPRDRNTDGQSYIIDEYADFIEH